MHSNQGHSQGNWVVRALTFFSVTEIFKIKSHQTFSLGYSPAATVPEKVIILFMLSACVYACDGHMKSRIYWSTRCLG